MSDIADDKADKKFQYYYRVTACMANSAQAADCTCWHDEGTGPCADERYDIKINKLGWREKPDSAPVIAKCRNCGSERYQTQHLYSNYRQNLYAVECGDCKYDIIPVTVLSFIPENDFYEAFRSAWNAANAVPEHKQDKSCGQRGLEPD